MQGIIEGRGNCLWVRSSLFALGPDGPDPEVFPQPSRPQKINLAAYPLLGLTSPSERIPERSPPPEAYERAASLSWDSSPYSACRIGSPPYPGLPGPVRSPSRVSHPPGGFLLPKPPGPVSYRDRSWGSSSRAFPSRGYGTLSSLVTLLALPCRRSGRRAVSRVLLPAEVRAAANER